MTPDEKKWLRKQKASERRKALRAKAIAFMGGRCSICLYDRCQASLDFHHLDGSTKDFSISERLTSWARILPELKKCVLICSNCHREVHDGLHPTFLDIDESTGPGDLD